MIRGKAGRKGKTDVDTLATAAVAIVNALQPNAWPKSPVATVAHASTADGISPGKVQLRSQFLQAEKDTILQTLHMTLNCLPSSNLLFCGYEVIVV